MGKPLPELLPSVKDDEKYLKAVEWAKQGIQSFLPSSRKFAHSLHVETHVIPLKSGESVIGVMFLIHDVSHRIKKEEELQTLNNELQNRLRQLKLTARELAHLTHIATHNIKEPIRNLYTSIEWLIETEARSVSNSGRASFRRMQSTLNRMNLLLDDIITLTHINIVERPENFVDLKEVVPEVLKFLEQKIKETRASVTTGKLCEIRAHRNQVYLLLQHIVHNVVRYNKSEQPAVHISCGREFIEQDKPVQGNTGEYYKLSIVHNGDGFENIDPNNIFDSIEKSTEPSYIGGGIAMVITAKVMEAHAGFYTVEHDKNGNKELNCFFRREA